MSFVPAALQVAVVGGRVRVADAELQQSCAWEGLKPAHGDDGFINGTRIRFPAGGPRCRYEALFDARAEFDALRESFMTFAPESSPRPFFDLARDALSDGTHTPFLRSLSAWVECPSSLREPVAFGRWCWEAYMECLNVKTFYFSVEELIAVCLVANVNVAVSRKRAAS